MPIGVTLHRGNVVRTANALETDIPVGTQAREHVRLAVVVEGFGELLRRATNVAEEYNVKLAMHPDDPPLSPIRGFARIMSSIENYQKLLDMIPSPVNGIALCQGNFTLMTDDLPGVIRHFGFTSHGTSQQGFTCPWGANQQYTARDACADVMIFLRIA